MNKTGRTIRELSSRCLAFSEKFTTLGKVIANTLNIARTLRNIGLTASGFSNNLAKDLALVTNKV